ncbi:hypothetical protein ACQ4PT_009245 [Festuca glaucescens]
MELCSGGELLDRVAARGSYSERQAAAACRDVLTVVHVCHSMGVMHRDLRPENFLLASSAEDAPLKAVHFGLSVFIEQGKVYEEIVGSAYYVAPEVLHRNYGREIDVWSAGVILYILLCGSPPFWAGKRLSPEEIEGLKQMFSNMDTDKSGKITLEELRIGLTSKIGEAEVDVDKRGNIDYTEFLAAMMNKHYLEKEEDLLLPFQHLDKDNNGHTTHGEKDGTRVVKTSKSSDRKNENKEAEQELNKPDDNMVMEEVPSSQAELDKKLEEELRKKLLAQKLAGGTGVSISGNNEQHILQDNNMHDMGVDGGLGKNEKEVNNYEYQDKNHVRMEDITDDKINSDAFSRKHEYSAQQIQESNQDGGTDTHESASGTLAGEKYIEEVNSSQVTTGVDKENFVEIGRRIVGEQTHIRR